MSFTISKVANSVILYPEFGVTDTTDSEQKTVLVTYQAVQLDSLLGGIAKVLYTTQIGNSQKFYDFVEFEYSGAGNPLLEAEIYLKSIS